MSLNNGPISEKWFIRYFHHRVNIIAFTYTNDDGYNITRSHELVLWDHHCVCAPSLIHNLVMRGYFICEKP